jgi:hypothetical protein
MMVYGIENLVFTVVFRSTPQSWGNYPVGATGTFLEGKAVGSTDDHKSLSGVEN